MGVSEGMDEETDLHEKGPQRMLEGGDRAVGVGEGSLEMRDDVGRGSVRGFCGGQLRRRTASRQCRADLALSLVEPFPDALQGPVTQMAVGVADGRENAAGGGALEEPPQSGGGEAEPSDLVGEPDAESPPAATTCIAVAAKDPPGAQRPSPRAGVVKAVEEPVPNQRADDLAVRTGRLLEPFGNRVPFLGAAVEPSHLAHGGYAFAKIAILAGWEWRGSSGVRESSWSGVRGKSCETAFAKFLV